MKKIVEMANSLSGRMVRIPMNVDRSVAVSFTAMIPVKFLTSKKRFFAVIVRVVNGCFFFFLISVSVIIQKALETFDVEKKSDHGSKGCADQKIQRG